MDPVLYHAHHTLRSDDLAFWRDLAQQAPGKILELGCGTGRVLLRLVRDNHQVVGLDNDPVMLDFLHNLIPPTLSNSVEIHEGDMRDFNLGETFPLVILPCNTLSTFSGGDRSRVFRAVRQHLAPGGVFVFGIPNPLVLADLPMIGDEELEDEFTHPATNNPVHVYSSWERSADRIAFFWRYDHVFPDGKVSEVTHSTSHFLDSPQTYVAEMKAAGLKPFAVYGDFYREKFVPDSSYFITLARAAA